MTIKKIIEIFDSLFPNPVCELNFSSNFELLIAVILSAQCTDKRVNLVTEKLFKKANTPKDILKMGQIALEREIFSCGFYKNKAKNIINASKDIIERFNGNVPDNINDLLTLSGVGNKTANVVVSVGFSQDAFAVDTHVLRVSNRLGFAKTRNPDICERQLKKFFQKKNWSKLHHQMVLFGRYICKSQNPNCEDCLFSKICEYKK